MKELEKNTMKVCDRSVEHYLRENELRWKKRESINTVRQPSSHLLVKYWQPRYFCNRKQPLFYFVLEATNNLMFVCA